MKKIFAILCIFGIFAVHAAIFGADEHLTGRFDPKEDSFFVIVPLGYSCKDSPQYLRKEAMQAFKKMADAAKISGITLKIISATRTFYDQKAIWEAKWNGTNEGWKDVHAKYPDPKARALAILRYSSMPGTSRHHWGTDVDINSIEPEYFATGQGKKEYEWLLENAKNFGYYPPYTPKNSARPNGYEEEKWHWSYLPLSKNFLKKYQATITLADIQGFNGDETATLVNVIQNYVLGISQECM